MGCERAPITFGVCSCEARSLARSLQFRPPPQPFTTCKWTKVCAPPPTLHVMTWGRPPNGQGLGAPRNPSRLANGQGLPPPTLHDKGWGPRNPSRLGGGFQMDKGWGRLPSRQGLGAPQPRFANGQGLGPNPSRLSPNPARLADGQGLGAPTLHDLRMDKGWGPPNPSRLANLKFCLGKHWGLQTIERLSIFHRGPGASPQSETSMTSPSSQNVRLSKFKIVLEQGFEAKSRKIHDRALRPRTYPNANLKF